MIEVHEVVTDQQWKDYLNIRHVVFIQEQQVPEEEEIDVYEEEATHFLATYEREPAGSGRFRFKGGLIKFERLATLKKFRGKGVASALMDLMEKRAKMKHSDYLPLMHAQVDAIPFYLKRGWTLVGEVFDESGIDHQIMVLLPQSVDHLKCLKDPETPRALQEFLLKWKGQQ